MTLHFGTKAMPKDILSHRTVWLCVALSIALPVLAADISAEMLAAAKDGNVEAVNALVSKGQDVNATSPDGVTALMVAASEDKVEVVKLLLASGADLRLQTKTGKTASYFAEARGYREIVLLLQQTSAAAGATTQSTATLQETLDFIRAKLEEDRVSGFVKRGNGDELVSSFRTTDFSVNGCQVKWSSHFTSKSKSSSWDDEDDIALDLSRLDIRDLKLKEHGQPDRDSATVASKSQPHVDIIMPSTAGKKAWTVTSRSTTTGPSGVETTDPTTLEKSSLNIHVSDRTLADRLAKAFTNAAKLCGAKPDPF